MGINFKIKGASTSERGSSFWAVTDANMKFNIEVEWQSTIKCHTGQDSLQDS